MKNLNLIKRLWTDSHEKQSPQRFARYAAMLIMLLTLGVGQMWAAWYVVGDNMPYGWSNVTANKMSTSGSTETAYLSLAAGLNYDFKLYGGNWSNGQARKANNKSSTVSLDTDYQTWDNNGADGDKMRFSPTVTGVYKFVLNTSTNELRISYEKPSAAAPSAVVSGTNVMFYIESYSGIELAVTKNSTSDMVNATSVGEAKAYVNIAKSKLSTYYYITNNRGGWVGDGNTGIKTATGGELFVKSGSGNTSAATATTTASVTSETLSISTTTSATSGVLSGSLYIQYYIDGSFAGVTYSASTASYGDIPAGGATARASTYNVSGLSNGSHTLKTVLTDGIIYYVADQDNFNVAHTYSVTLDDDGDYQGNGSATVKYGDKALTVSSHASRTSWNLVGYWNSSAAQVTDASGNLIANVTGYTNSSGEWIYEDDVKLYAHWSKSYSVTYNANGGTGTTTDASSPYAPGTDVTVLSNSFTYTGYTFTGWNTEDGGTGTPYAAGSTIEDIDENVTLYAQWSENKSTVSVVASPTGAGTFSSTSVSAGVDTKPTVTATAQPGYKFASWGITGGANMSGSTDNPVTITGKGAGAAATLTATFNRTYAFVEGRFQVYNAARNTRTNTALDNGGWNESQCYIPFSYDGTNHRFELHTYSTPKELSDNIFDNAPVFYVKLSTASGSLSNVVSYWSASSQTLSAASTKKTLTHTGDLVNYNLKFSSADESGYAVLYFDEAGVWYELEQRLQYNGNGSDGGSAPSNNGNYFMKGTKAAAGSNGYTKTGYHFTGWKVNNAGDLISAGSNVTMNSNITLYAQWEADTYTNVTIDDNGGSADGKYSVTYYATSLTVTTEPTKTGYEPEGYYTNAACTTKVANADGSLIANRTYTDGSGRWTSTASPTLYTKWQAKTYTAENNIDGNSGSNGKYTATYDATSIAINTAPTRTGYNLTGYHAWGREANTLANTAGALSASQSENKTGGKTLTNSSSQWIYDGSDATIYADWSPKTYSITLDQEGGASGSTSVTMTYDASTHTAITNPTKTGYTFGGYWTGDNGTGSMVIATDGTLQASVDGYTGAGGIWKKDATCTLYAKWTANNYTVTLSASGETGYGSSPSGVKDDVSATFDALMPAMGTAPTPAPGYKFMGYFMGQNGTGVQYYAADGSSLINWTTASNTTLYAYFRKTEISSLTHPAAVAKGDVVYVVVDPVFNQTGAQNYMDICWSLLYDNNNPVESGWTVESYTEGGTKPNQVRFTLTSMASGYYQIKAVLKASDSDFDACSTGTELSTVKSNLTVAGNSTVTILYQDDSGNTIAASSSVEVARGDSIGIKAPSIIGYAFDEWVLGDVLSSSCRNAATCGLDKDSINIKAAYDGYLTAKYTKKQMIYFNNTLDWDTVYVYFYNNSNYWGGDNQGTGANTSDFSGAYTGKHGGMTKIPGTTIYYFDLAANSVSTSLTNVAFTEIDQDGAGFFYANNVIGRGDYSGTLSMYVPLAGVVPVTKNGTGEYMSNYYEKGYWMNYPESTGYTLKIYDNTGAGALVKERAFEFPANKAMPMSVTVDLEGGNKTYGFKIYRDGGTWFRNGGTMTNGHSGDEGQAAWVFGIESGTNCGLTTTSAGNYTFKVWVNSDGNHQVGVHYPESTGDFRVMYTDVVRIDNHDGSEGASWLLSSVIPGNTERDTISYFVRAEGGKHPKFKIQKCTVTDDPLHPGEEEYRTVGWADQGDEIEVPDSITENGVYNFIFAKNDGNLELQKIEPYEGNFYIRVDGAGSSNWDNFRAADHLMPYSDYSFKQSENPYSHYFTQWYKVEKVGGDVKVKNIKFVVANDYSVCVSDTIVKDGVADDYVDTYGYITRSANIRFMYNYKTNVATRRYVDGAQESGSEFLMIIPGNSKIYAAAAGGDPLTQLTFSDKGNWIYEADVYALPTATYKLKSKFGATASGDASQDWERKGEIIQYFKGGESSTETLIGGDPESTTRVKIRLLYDFKTNRVVAAYQPSSGTIDANMEINADIMFMREHQGDIEQITFAEGKSISKIENIYCCLKFNKYTLNNLSKDEPHGLLPSLLSRYERDIFYVSFPYDVRLSDVIGFGTYGQHWIVEYYDGAARAKNGFWSDSESYWKFVTPAMKDTFTLKAGTGYIVALDLDEMWYLNDTYHADIWNNTAEVELLFPGDVNSISNQAVTYNMPSHECTINRGTTAGNRTKKDSHWNVLGVPTFKNITGLASGATDDGGGSGAIVFSNTAWIQGLENELRFIYDGNLADNSLTPKAVKDFEFKAMHGYVVQYCGDVTFTTSATPAPAIIARRTYAEAPQEVDFRLELTKDGVMEDQTFISLSNDENTSADFEFGEDLSKEFNTNRANIYTFIGTEWVAGNTLPMSEQTTVVPVGVKTAADGDYTFAMPEGTSGVGVTLVDTETGIRTSLSALDYTINLTAGTYDERFYLEISPIVQNPTGIEDVTGDGSQVTGARKVIIDQKMYIIKDGKMFDAQGRQVK